MTVLDLAARSPFGYRLFHRKFLCFCTAVTVVVVLTIIKNHHGRHHDPHGCRDCGIECLNYLEL